MGQSGRHRYAVVGLGGRAQLYTTALAGPYADRAELVGFCDTNATRMRAHNNRLARLFGLPEVPAYRPVDFGRMLQERRVDTVVVASPDVTHDEYVVAALQAGCDVVTEKPMTIDAERARRILEASAASEGRVTVAFNYRYNPIHEKVREILAAGAVGDIGSVHFEWLLDVRHGADYFRRWHRDKQMSGGLMVHKSTHHFDLVNWWLQTSPDTVYGSGSLFFYGEENGRRRGLARDYLRAHGAAEAQDDPFALRLADSPDMRALFLDAEHEDGYHRDQNVFAPGITIEDDMAVLVRYSSGATMTYHLTAYSPWEGYRISFNGSGGRLELVVKENEYAASDVSAPVSAVLHGGDEAPVDASAQLVLHPLWCPPEIVQLPPLGGGHGGGDERMLEDLFGDEEEDALERKATEVDGARSLATGLAANRSFETGLPVKTATVLAI